MFEKIIGSAKDKLKDYLNYIFLFLAFLFIVSLIRNILKINQANKEILEAEERVDEAIAENNELKAKVEGLRSPEFQEMQLRDKLNLAKEGEIVVVLPDEEILRKLAPKRIEEESILPDPTWRRWLKLFY
jgi:cell division protein FtsB